MEEKMKVKIKGKEMEPDEIAQNLVRTKKPSRTNYSSSSKVQNFTVFSIIYMIRIRFFGLGE